MTPQVYGYVQSLKLTGKCLDVGSYDVNGSVKALFPDYTGMDMREGPNVDIVKDICIVNKWETCETMDVVTCLEMLEHCREPFLAVRNMAFFLKKGGALVITVPSITFPKHDYPSDYWRFLMEGVSELMLQAGVTPMNCSTDKDHVYMMGIK